MIQYYYTKKEWGVVMEKEELKILEELRRILNSKNEAIVILNNYFKGGVGKSKLSTMFAYLTDKFNLKVLMIDKDLQATLTKDLAKTFKVELPRVNFYEGLKNGNLASSIVHLTDNLDLIPGTFDLMLLPKLTRSWTFENESRLLATLLAPLKSDYDLIIIDTVPTPSVYTNNAIVASDYVMIPLQAEEESTNNIQNYISYLIDLQEQFNPGLDMIGFVPYLVDTDSATIKSNLEELYKQHKEDNLVFQNIIKRSNKVSTWSKNGITEHKGYDKKVLSMYENVFFEMLERIIQLENEYVLDKAKENTSYCPKKVKVKIIHDPAPNAFALGRQTLCITDGLLLLSDDMILGILAHEIGHLSYGHTVIQLLIGGGNIFISGCLLLIKISYWIFSAIMGLFAICSRSGVMGIITAVFAGISTALSWLWVKFCMLFLMWSMRQNEYLADEFAYKIGFGLELATVLDQHISDVPHDGFLSAIYSTHPCNDDRVAALQNLGVPYSRY